MSLDTRLRSVFNTVLELDKTLPDSALRYQETPGWDSLGAVLLISSIEDEFKVEIDTERALKMDTFNGASRSCSVSLGCRSEPAIVMTGSPISQERRETMLLPQMVELIEHHRRACPAYARVLDAIGHAPGRRYTQTRELPWLPVRLFKEHALISTGREQVAVLTSSGTTSTNVSRIALDRDAAERQRRLLTATLATVTGSRRLPLLIIDSPSAVRGERSSIRGATVLGVMNVGRDHVFALDDEQSIDATAVANFLQRHAHATFLIFGFTSLVWTRFHAFARTRGFDLAHAILLHTGGWKKLADQAVSPQEFRAGVLATTGLRRCHNFYGMVERAADPYRIGIRRWSVLPRFRRCHHSRSADVGGSPCRYGRRYRSVERGAARSSGSRSAD